MPASVVAEMKTAEADIISGKLKPFTGPIKDQTGTQRAAAGGALSDGDIKGMTWLVEGVQGTLPKT
jgi:simple sugar transport system substrate-binding protein